ESGARGGGPAAFDPGRSAQHAGASAAAAARRTLGSPVRAAGAWGRRGRAEERITFGCREWEGARAALAGVRSRRPHTRVGIIGTSLGGAAVLLGPQPIGVDAVVVEAVFPDIRTSLENRVRIRLGPLAPVLAPLLVVQ